MDITQLSQLWPVLMGLVVSPVAQWLKRMLPGTWGIQPIAYSVILSAGVALGIHYIYHPGLTLLEWIGIIGLTDKLSQITHATGVTKKIVA